MRLSVFFFSVNYMLARLKTRFYYVFFFDRIGGGSAVFRPLHLYNSEAVSLGSHVLIRRGLRLEVLRRPDGRKARIEIGDHTNIEQNCHLICQNKIVIGKRVSITGNVAIVDTTHPYNDDKTGDAVSFNNDEVVIGDNVFIGFGTVILPGTRIGSHCYVGALSVVKGIFPDKAILAGSPARVVKSI